MKHIAPDLLGELLKFYGDHEIGTACQPTLDAWKELQDAGLLLETRTSASPRMHWFRMTSEGYHIAGHALSAANSALAPDIEDFLDDEREANNV